MILAVAENALEALHKQLTAKSGGVAHSNPNAPR